VPLFIHFFNVNFYCYFQAPGRHVVDVSAFFGLVDSIASSAATRSTLPTRRPEPTRSHHRQPGVICHPERAAPTRRAAQPGVGTTTRSGSQGRLIIYWSKKQYSKGYPRGSFDCKHADDDLFYSCLRDSSMVSLVSFLL